MVQPFWKTVWQFLVKLNRYLPCEPAISLLDIYPREMQVYAHIKPIYSNVYRSSVYNHQRLEITQISFSGWWINRHQILLHPYNGILLKKKKERTTDSCDNIKEIQVHYAIKEANLKKLYILHNSVYMTFWKWQKKTLRMKNRLVVDMGRSGGKV